MRRCRIFWQVPDILDPEGLYYEVWDTLEDPWPEDDLPDTDRKDPHFTFMGTKVHVDMLRARCYEQLDSPIVVLWEGRAD